MDSLKTPFLPTPFPSPQTPPKPLKPSKTPKPPILCSVTPDPWSLSDGNPYKRHKKKPLSDDNARRIIKGKAKYLSELRRNQGSQAQTPKWIRRTPEQMVRYLEDERDGNMYGKHVVAAIQIVRNLATKAEGSYNMREVMGSFVTKLTFKEMCVVLKEQKGWRQVRDFFAWMKLQVNAFFRPRREAEAMRGLGALVTPRLEHLRRQHQGAHLSLPCCGAFELSYRPSVIVYTVVIRVYGQVGKIKFAEQTFLEMLEAGCEPDEVACGTMLCAYARWGRPKAMLSFYSAVQERGILPSVAVFNFMISSLQKKSLHGKVIQLWEQMMEAGIQPNHFTYTIVICSYVKEGLLENAFETFHKMKKSGFVPEEVTYSLLISLNSRTGNQDESLRLYREMRSIGIIPSNYTCASLLTIYYKNGHYSKALSLFSEMSKNKIVADEVIYGLLIRIYGKLGLYEEAEKTFKDIEKLGLLTEEKTYVTMAQVHLNAGKFDKALNVFGLMRSKNILFSRFAYIVLLKCYAMKEDVSSAEVTFQALCKTGLPDANSCKDILNLYVRLGFLKKAKAFIVQMKKNHVQFDEELFKSVMRVYCKERMLGEAEQLLEEVGKTAFAKDSNFIQTSLMAANEEPRSLYKDDNSSDALSKPDPVALEMLLTLYLVDGDTSQIQRTLKSLLQSVGGLTVANQLISKFAREGDISKMESLYDQVIKMGYRPDGAAIASMISLYGRLQQLNRAKEVFSAVAESPTSMKSIYSSMIDAYVKCGKPDEAHWTYKEMIEKGHEIDAVTISILVNAMTIHGKYREAEKVIRGSFQQGLELDTVAYNTFIKAMLEAGKLYFASSVYERMLSSGVAPSIQTYNTMISVFGRGRKLDKATEMFNLAGNLDAPLDEKAYTNIISYYGKAGKSQEASLLFSKMQEEGIKPGKVSYNIMINVYATVGQYHEAEKLFQAMQSDGLSPDSFTYQALLRAYTLGNNYLKAEETIKTMQKVGIRPSCAHFDLLISAFAKGGLIADAERVYTELTTAGLNPNLACHQSMLRGYMDYGYVKEGIFLFERICESVEPDRFVLSSAVHLYRTAGNEIKADSVLDTMNKLGVPFLQSLRVGSKMKVG